MALLSHRMGPFLDRMLDSKEDEVWIGGLENMVAEDQIHCALEAVIKDLSEVQEQLCKDAYTALQRLP